MRPLRQRHASRVEVKHRIQKVDKASATSYAWTRGSVLSLYVCGLERMERQLRVEIIELRIIPILEIRFWDEPIKVIRSIELRHRHACSFLPALIRRTHARTHAHARAHVHGTSIRTLSQLRTAFPFFLQQLRKFNPAQHRQYRHTVIHNIVSIAIQ